MRVINVSFSARKFFFFFFFYNSSSCVGFAPGALLSLDGTCCVRLHACYKICFACQVRATWRESIIRGGLYSRARSVIPRCSIRASVGPLIAKSGGGPVSRDLHDISGISRELILDIGDPITRIYYPIFGLYPLSS